jgi:hypothetical protein
MKMNVAGLASAFVFLIAVSALRLGDKPTFGSVTQEELFVSQIEKRLEGGRKEKGVKYKGLDVR